VPPASLTYPGATRDPYEGDPTTTFRFDEDLEFILSIVEGRPSRPSFYDGMRCQAVVDAVLQSAAERRWVDVADVPPVQGRVAAAIS
jgi:predicted dehydrogenase